MSKIKRFVVRERESIDDVGMVSVVWEVWDRDCPAGEGFTEHKKLCEAADEDAAKAIVVAMDLLVRATNVMQAKAEKERLIVFPRNGRVG